jgi:hypothetical protein
MALVDGDGIAVYWTVLLAVTAGAAQSAAILQRDDTGDGDGIAVYWTALLAVAAGAAQSAAILQRVTVGTAMASPCTEQCCWRWMVVQR